jgi:iron-sulfur cluster protein
VSVESFEASPPFPKGASVALGNPQLRRNLARATATIRGRRNAVVAELGNFEQLRLAGAAIKDSGLSRLDALLVELEANVTAAGGHVHFARDAQEASEIVTSLVVATGEREVVKVKSMTTAEIELNGALERAGIDVKETDLAELIVQLGHDLPSHIVVPAIHRNRAEIRSTFLSEMGKSGVAAPPGLTDEPADLATAARAHLRARFLSAKVAISGANFAIADSGSLVVVESEGNGRMCLTLPETLISVVGIDKVIPSYRDLDVYLQLLARSATGERMNPYTSIWTGVTPGDGPSTFHLVLLDNGRSTALADPFGREALRCIRCAACLNVCPVYERVGGHAYGSVYPGPIGAVLAPQLDHVVSDPVAASLPYASTLCGACFEVCPVRIDIPKMLVHLRGDVVDAHRGSVPSPERVAMGAVGWIFARAGRMALAERIAGLGSRIRIRRLPGPLGAWTDGRDAPSVARESFRAWWSSRPSTTGLVNSGSNGTSPGREGSPNGRAETAPALGVALRSSRATVVARLTTAARTTADRVRSHRDHHVAVDPTVAPRDAVLGAIRSSLARHPLAPPEVDRSYRDGAASHEGQPDPVALFVDRLRDYRAGVTLSNATGVGSAVRAAIERQGSTRVITPEGLDPSWIAPTTEGTSIAVTVDDGSAGALELDGFGSTVTAAAIGIAETGTVILDGGTGQGRRSISLVPDHLVVIIRADQVRSTVPEAVAVVDPRSPQTWISGPSATSDIELQRVEGVHGPRTLDVIVVE